MAIQLPYNPAAGGHTYAARGPYCARITWTPIPPSKSSPPHRSNWSSAQGPAFTPFPKLPPELRVKIWAYAAPNNRVIEIRSWGVGRYAPIKFSITPHRLPSIFRVNRESRREALCLYKLVEIGVSAAQLLPNRKYVDWKYHPTNPNSDPAYTVGTAPLPYATPYPPCKVYLSFSRDIIYLGPEFRLRHIYVFLTSIGAGHELSGLQYIALSGKFWQGSSNGRSDELRAALYHLKARPVREVMIVPDDEKNALEDRWYYRWHEIKLLEPPYSYCFQPHREGFAKTVVKNLQEWFRRLWQDDCMEAEEGRGLVRKDWCKEGHGEHCRRVVWRRGFPSVSVKSVRRNGHSMADFKDGMWDVQASVGDMRLWKTWTPPNKIQYLM